VLESFEYPFFFVVDLDFCFMMSSFVVLMKREVFLVTMIFVVSFWMDNSLSMFLVNVLGIFVQIDVSRLNEAMRFLLYSRCMCRYMCTN